ncbi:Elongator subunit elp2 [Blyttiomyces sp. JEL0837]|nr:Elongator subunit elp2 [Blyttiomyces sp. JEL0837]
MIASLEFTSAACNRVAQGVDWSLDGTVAFAAQNNIALYYPHDPLSRGIQQTLKGHTDRVNAVRFLRRGELKQKDHALVSASADKTLKIWKRTSSGTFVNSATLEGHTSAITSLGVSRGLSIPGSKDLIASAASDGTVRLWERTEFSDTEDKVECVEVINTGTKFAMALSIAFLPYSSVPFLITGGTDMKVHIYIKSEAKFEHILALPGHTDWIRTIDVATFTSTRTNSTLLNGFNHGDLIIATASQDRYIRLWKISTIVESRTGGQVGGMVAAREGDEFDQAIEMLQALAGEDGDGSRQLSTKAHIIEVNAGERKIKYTVMFDALLIGHEDWVHSVSFENAVDDADKSVIIWRPDGLHAIWNTDVRLGEVGGTALGYYGAVFNPAGNSVLAQGYHGALQLWTAKAQGSVDWTPAVGISGHFLSVEDLSWSPSGNFLVSTSLDQTTRLWGTWARDGNKTWHEIARPQVHGYDLHCISFFHPYGFVSGADEKVIRVFEAPKTFLESLEKISGIKESEEVLAQRPAGASIPALGLSNKAILNGSGEANSKPMYDPIAPQAVTGPPSEQYLVQNTLWPEVNKLYGHGFELIAVAASHDGKLIASASKAAKSEHAVIRLWNTSNWKEISPPLASHSLTVTSIIFSHDDKWILSGGRDRAWSLFKREENGAYELHVTNTKSHSRIIWNCSWSSDDRFFATGSRDKSVKIWKVENISETSEPVSVIKLDVGVTALDFTTFDGKSNILAVGLESGQIQIYSLDADGSTSDNIFQVPTDLCHSSPVKSLAWKPATIATIKDEGAVLASGSEDHSVRLFRVSVK